MLTPLLTSRFAVQNIIFSSRRYWSKGIYQSKSISLASCYHVVQKWSREVQMGIQLLFQALIEGEHSMKSPCSIGSHLSQIGDLNTVGKQARLLFKISFIGCLRLLLKFLSQFIFQISFSSSLLRFEIDRSLLSLLMPTYLKSMCFVRPWDFKWRWKQRAYSSHKSRKSDKAISNIKCSIPAMFLSVFCHCKCFYLSIIQKNPLSSSNLSSSSEAFFDSRDCSPSPPVLERSFSTWGPDSRLFKYGRGRTKRD